jgi:hypothetical protein
MSDDRKFFYKCSNGHDMASPKEQTKCLAIVKGSPCKGTLTRYGKGSRAETKGQ